jgi:hypothetical protein
MSRHVLMMTIAGIAQSCEVSQPGGSATPRKRSTSLTGPNCGLNSRFQTSPIATIEVM